MKNEFSKMDAGLLHLANKKVLLKLINQKGQISRSELSKATKLTPPTITRIVDELVYKDNLAEYIGTGSSNGGRPSMIVKFKNEGNYIIGIDLGATYIRGGLVDLNAKFVYEIQVPTEIEKGFSSIIEKVANVIQKLKSRQELNSKVWGVGIGVAGLVDSKTGMIESSPDFGWSKIDLRKELEDRLGLPFFYDNSTRLMALGELKLGAKQNLKNFAVINLGYGIASGLVIEGNLVKGHVGFAGEFGHISVDTESSVKCKCGMYGCLEALASGHRIAALGKHALTNHNSQILNELCNGNPNLITAELVAKAAQMGDKSCLKIYNEVIEYLCKGIGIIANLLNPEIVYLGGGISLNEQFLFDLVQAKKSKYLLYTNTDMPIVPSTFGEQATIIGAVSLVLEKIMNLELLVEE
ncbi:ROK family protein [Maribellus comscasis]|uniref:ROK family protein n=1 Tax=Maribellus comscasis TaxID=2681766 RepID=A0A6I6K2Q1_9BACT|nr:ROK family transcriptional regulator [Maribellus comscasis]QGY46787.1 ROK family protein [Maribellus comscasis]